MAWLWEDDLTANEAVAELEESFDVHVSADALTAMVAAGRGPTAELHNDGLRFTKDGLQLWGARQVLRERDMLMQAPPLGHELEASSHEEKPVLAVINFMPLTGGTLQLKLMFHGFKVLRVGSCVPICKLVRTKMVSAFVLQVDNSNVDMAIALQAMAEEHGIPRVIVNAVTGEHWFAEGFLDSSLRYPFDTEELISSLVSQMPSCAASRICRTAGPNLALGRNSVHHSRCICHHSTEPCPVHAQRDVC